MLTGRCGTDVKNKDVDGTKTTMKGPPPSVDCWASDEATKKVPYYHESETTYLLGHNLKQWREIHCCIIKFIFVLQI